jgi:hypothetical protein
VRQLTCLRHPRQARFNLASELSQEVARALPRRTGRKPPGRPRIRRGEDMVKAVALAARAVMIGRAYLWGLAANGQAGVENVLTSCAAASTPRCSAWARPASAT